MSLASQSCQVNIDDAAHRHVIEHEATLQMDRASVLLEIGLPDIARVWVQPDA